MRLVCITTQTLPAAPCLLKGEPLKSRLERARTLSLRCAIRGRKPLRRSSTGPFVQHVACLARGCASCAPSCCWTETPYCWRRASALAARNVPIFCSRIRERPNWANLLFHPQPRHTTPVRTPYHHAPSPGRQLVRAVAHKHVRVRVVEI